MNIRDTLEMMTRERFHKQMLRHLICAHVGVTLAMLVQFISRHSSRWLFSVLAITLYSIIFYRSYEVVGA